jgi:sugar phosphate isomerase/epimerase
MADRLQTAHPSRRAVLAAGALLMTAALPGGRTAAGVRPKRPIFGLQLYPLLDALRADFAGTLRHVAAMGFRQVEMLTFMGRSAESIRPILDACGLECPSVHVLAQTMPGTQEPSLTGNLDKLVAQVRVLGAHTVVLPSFPPPPGMPPIAPGEDYTDYFRRSAQRMTADDWNALADLLNERGAALAKAGLTLAYHNHNVEFAPIAGTTGYAILLDRVDPKCAVFELDVGWVRAAGLDPVTLLRQYPGRVKLMHVKDLTSEQLPNFDLRMTSVPVGAGIMNWEAILQAAGAAGVEHYFIEQEPPFLVPAEQSVAKSLQYLDSLRL